MRRLLPVVVLLSTLAVGCAFGGDGDDGNEAIEDADLVLEIGRTFEEADEPLGLAGATAEGQRKTRVLISLDDSPKETMTADIRIGGCTSSIGGGAMYPLNAVEDGRSETLVDVPLPELRDRGYIIWIEDGLCGDFFGAEEGEEGIYEAE